MNAKVNEHILEVTETRERMFREAAAPSALVDQLGVSTHAIHDGFIARDQRHKQLIEATEALCAPRAPQAVIGAKEADVWHGSSLLLLQAGNPKLHSNRQEVTNTYGQIVRERVVSSGARFLYLFNTYNMTEPEHNAVDDQAQPDSEEYGYNDPKRTFWITPHADTSEILSIGASLATPSQGVMRSMRQSLALRNIDRANDRLERRLEQYYAAAQQ